MLIDICCILIVVICRIFRNQLGWSWENTELSYRIENMLLILMIVRRDSCRKQATSITCRMTVKMQLTEKINPNPHPIMMRESRITKQHKLMAYRLSYSNMAVKKWQGACFIFFANYGHILCTIYKAAPIWISLLRSFSYVAGERINELLGPCQSNRYSHIVDRFQSYLR